MLGLGLGINKSVFTNKKYVLDYVGGITSTGCVFGKSLYLLSNKYKGYCLQIQRQSDSTTSNIGFKNGYVDYLAIETFCAATNGRVKIWYDQTGGNNAIQNTWANMPQICTNGVFDAGGIKYVSSSNSYMTVADYAAIQIISPNMCWYCNFTKSSTMTNWLFVKAEKYNLNEQIALFYTDNNLHWNTMDTELNAGAVDNNTFKTMFSWFSKSANGVTVRTTKAGSTADVLATRSDDSTNKSGFFIGSSTSDGITKLGFLDGYVNTILAFNTNQLSNYSFISTKC